MSRQLQTKLEAPYTLIQIVFQRRLGQRYLSIQGKEIVSATKTDICLLIIQPQKLLFG